jgi:hypothetical protein
MQYLKTTSTNGSCHIQGNCDWVVRAGKRQEIRTHLMTVADSSHMWKLSYCLSCKRNAAGVFAKAQRRKIIGVKEHSLCIQFCFTRVKTAKDAYKMSKATFRKKIWFKQSSPFKESMPRSQSWYNTRRQKTGDQWNLRQNTGISYGTWQVILIEDAGMRRISGQFRTRVTQMLSHWGLCRRDSWLKWTFYSLPNYITFAGFGTEWCLTVPQIIPH